MPTLMTKKLSFNIGTLLLGEQCPPKGAPQYLLLLYKNNLKDYIFHDKPFDAAFCMNSKPKMFYDLMELDVQLQLPRNPSHT